jgi:hypothetical protein
MLGQEMNCECGGIRFLNLYRGHNDALFNEPRPVLFGTGIDWGAGCEMSTYRIRHINVDQL